MDSRVKPASDEFNTKNQKFIVIRGLDPRIHVHKIIELLVIRPGSSALVAAIHG
jgi:hypothetical protein